MNSNRRRLASAISSAEAETSNGDAPVMNFNEEQAAFHMAIGRAITQWSLVDYSMYLIADRCADLGHPNNLPAVFFISDFPSRVSFVARLFNASPHCDRLGNHGSALLDQVKGLSKRRNAIAHGRVTFYHETPPGHRFAIVPPLARAPENSPPRGSPCVSDIDLAARQFELASMRLQGLYSALRGDPAQPELLALPEPLLRSLAELTEEVCSMAQRQDLAHHD
jgi:hypothetical protein